VCPEQLKTAVREARRGTRFTTRALTKSGFGSPMRPGLDARFERSQNLVSMKVPEVIESLRASCSGKGIVMVRVTTFAVGELPDELELTAWRNNEGKTERMISR